MNKILIVEDDGDINNLLTKIMKKQGYEVVQAFSGTEAVLRIFDETDGKRTVRDYCLILLDLMLPGLMGEEVLKMIKADSDIPVIVLSAKSSLEDRVDVLTMGADDYITKPFAAEEVIARANGAIKRYERYQNRGQEEVHALAYKKLTLLLNEREAKVSGKVLNLSAHEFDILKLLVENPNKVFSRENLYEEIWKGGYYGEDNTVNMHISNLRRKLSEAVEEEYIKTVWGIGYKMA